MAVDGVTTERLSVNLPAIWEFTGKISGISCHGAIPKTFSPTISMGYGILLIVLIMKWPRPLRESPPRFARHLRLNTAGLTFMLEERKTLNYLFAPLPISPRYA